MQILVKTAAQRWPQPPFMENVMLQSAELDEMLRSFEGRGWSLEDLRDIVTTVGRFNMRHVMNFLIDRLQTTEPRIVLEVLRFARAAYRRALAEGVHEFLARAKFDNLLPPKKMEEATVRDIVQGAIMAMERYDPKKVAPLVHQVA